MSVVIVGGHDRMVAQYKKICKAYKCKVKVFTHMKADFDKQIGCPDLLVLFTNTVSHKMVKTALDEIDSSKNRCCAFTYKQPECIDRNFEILLCINNEVKGLQI